MQYQGGKNKLAEPIAKKIRGGVLSDTLVSLFCGSCAVEAKLAPYFKKVICNDAHPYLMEMWKALQQGWEPPDIVTEAEYQYIKAHKDEDPALTAFVGFGCTFGAKWFGGYARDKRGCVTRGGTLHALKHPSLKSFLN
jgi:DNA adenine methylase